MTKTFIPLDVLIAIDVIGYLYARNWDYAEHATKIVGLLPGSYPEERIRHVLEVLAHKDYLVGQPYKGYYLNRGVLNRSLKRLVEDLGFDVLRDIEYNLDSPSAQLEEKTAFQYRNTTLSHWLQCKDFNDAKDSDSRRSLSPPLHPNHASD